MSSTNPFAPPLAHVRDIDHAPQTFQPVRIFSTKGRIGRVRYLAYTIGAMLVVTFLMMVMGGVAVASGGDPTLAVGTTIAVYVVLIVLNVMFLIQRSHDMDLSGWLSIVAFIPLAGLFWLLKSGTPGPNRYGAPPPPNTLGVKILAWLLPVIFVLGILAAIAVPAFNDFNKRGAAAQVK